MRNIVILTTVIFASKFLSAQTNIFPSSGNVGIGTTSPPANGKLSINYGNIFMFNGSAPYASGIFSVNTVYLADNQYLDISSGIYKAASNGTSNRLQLLYNYGLSFSNGSFASTDAAVTNTEVFRLSNTGGLSLGSSFVGTDPGSGNAIISGNVGIGTTNPTTRLHLFNPSSSTYLNIEKPNSTAEAGIVFSQNNTPLFYIWSDNTDDDALKIEVNGQPGEHDGAPRMMFPKTNKNIYMAQSGGNVGIGTTNTQGYRLAVNGDAIFTKVKVKPYNTWPDYVFHPAYKLRPLKDLEEYIMKNNHLPDVPSASDVEKNGLDVGDNQAALLKKIEELTMYIIEINKKMDKLSEENAALKKKPAATIHKD